MASKKKTNIRRAAARSKPKKRTTATRQKAVAKQAPVVAESDAARIIAAIKQIPRGKVCTYGVVAEVAGLPRRARLVGTVLRQTPASKSVPWFRVINASTWKLKASISSAAGWTWTAMAGRPGRSCWTSCCGVRSSYVMPVLDEKTLTRNRSDPRS
jgi:alkylated DNA nucleotide flippase Atl1